MERFFPLYTWQLPEWDVTTEKRDPTKGSRAWGDDTWRILKLLYKKLEKKIGTLSFLWCFTTYEHWHGSEIFRLWELDVPSSGIEHFLDSKIWESLFEDAQNNKQYDDMRWDQLVIKRSEGLKRISDENKVNITSLIKVPLSPSIMIVSNGRFNTGVHHGNTSLENLPTSICEAKKYRDPLYPIVKRRMQRLKPKKG